MWHKRIVCFSGILCVSPYQRISEIIKTSVVEAFEWDEDFYEVARLLNVKQTRHGAVVGPRGGTHLSDT